MSYQAEIQEAFLKAMNDFSNSRAMRLMRAGDITIEHYKSLLREIFHYAREDPQLQAQATVYFRGSDRECVKMFFKHATSEIGHDAMALDDLRTLGVDISSIPTSNPLPATTALTAFPFYQIQYRQAVGYLGYLYFLEHMPTQQGATYAQVLGSIGVPREAMTFLLEHTSVDIAHNKLMSVYIEKLVRTRADADEVIYAMRVTGQLYAEMIYAAFTRVDHSVDFGVNHCEAART
ncbi:MAG: iron-containing redox enzyme family protein [Proteobacteria bacterium]|nr:iron-containing redox enzyme family protein [Pseudomonadota bacterium]